MRDTIILSCFRTKQVGPSKIGSPDGCCLDCASSNCQFGQGLPWVEEDSGRPTGHFQLTISGRPLRLNLYHSVLPEGIAVGGSPRIYAWESSSFDRAL